MADNDNKEFIVSQEIEIADDEFAEDFLEHFGVKGMRWGHRKAADDASGSSRRDRAIARRQTINNTRAAVDKIKSKPVSRDRVDILKARNQLDKANMDHRRVVDQYKIDRQTMPRLEAKQAVKISAAKLNRIRKQADTLTPKEQEYYNSYRIGEQFSNIVFGVPKSSNKNDYALRTEAIKKSKETL